MAYGKLLFLVVHTVRTCEAQIVITDDAQKQNCKNFKM